MWFYCIEIKEFLMSYKVWYYNHNVILYIDFKTQSYKIYKMRFVNQNNTHIDEWVDIMYRFIYKYYLAKNV